MSTIITHPAREAHPRLDAAARNRADRLAKATPEQMQAALAFLSMIDDEAFWIAMTAATPDPAGRCTCEDEKTPIPLCTTCGAPVGIFPDVTLNWRHYRELHGRLRRPRDLRPRPRHRGRVVPRARGRQQVFYDSPPILGLPPDLLKGHSAI